MAGVALSCGDRGMKLFVHISVNQQAKREGERETESMIREPS